MRAALKANWLSMTVLACIVAIAFGVASYILLNQGFRPPWVHVYTIKAELATAQAIQPGQGQRIQVSGVDVGDVKKVYLHDGRPIVEMEIHKDKLAAVHADASLLVRPRTPLADMTIQLNPGTKSARKLHDGDTIPIAQTRTPVNVDEVLAGLDGDTRNYLRILLDAGGPGLKGRAGDVRRTLEATQGTLVHTSRITKVLTARRQSVRRLVHNLHELSGELADHDGSLRTLVTNSNTTFAALAGEDQALRASLTELPPTLQAADATLQNLRPFARAAQTSLTRLRSTITKATPALTGVRPLLQSAPSDLSSVRTFATQATPLVSTLRPSVGDLRVATPKLKATFDVVHYLVNELTYNPAAPHHSYLFWTAWFAHNLNSMLSLQDGIGTFWRGQVMVSCSAVTGLRVALPLLAPLYDLRVCPEQKAP